MSQIGYMMLAAGLGPIGYAFAIFHLLTHGFFKANMFLGAGSVMHGMNDDVNMRHYGALRKAMPVTFLTFAMGYLAIIGFPGFSGFWSKGGIIERALDDNWVAGVAAIIGAGVTGFYMTRLMLMTFFGEKRWEPEAHPHESPRVMTIPLIVLGALSAVGGQLLLADWIVNWLEPVVGPAPEHAAVLPAVVVGVIEFVVMVVGVLIAWWFVGRREVPRTAPVQVSFPVRAARADLYGDAINHELVLKPGGGLIHGLDGFDRDVIDGVVMGSASTMSGLSSWLRLTQNGYVRSYALSLLAGAGILLAAVLAVNLS
jgi:NADH-quinone oxidoreductase subunit L